MLPANLLTTLRALTLNDRPLITATPDKAAPLTHNLEPGQKVQGTVQAQLAPNLFRVQVANQQLQMQLPSFIKSGDTIQLQVVALLPRLTFTLAASANPVSTPDTLGAAARMLSDLSQQPLIKSYVKSLQNTPLMETSADHPDTAQLAGRLHDTLSKSGLFYEAHQAQWIAGTRPTAHLLQEPQNQLPQEAGSKPLPLVDAKSVVAQTATTETRPQSVNIPEHLQPLVQQQLNALETRQVMWQGQVWPGQEMQWEVREESPNHHTGQEEEGQWVTQLQLDLPRLGDISARLSLTGNTLRLNFEVGSELARGKLGSATTRLIEALAQQGISVSHTQIRQHEPAE